MYETLQYIPSTPSTFQVVRFRHCVYFETSSTSPYQIRRIEELNKTPSGNVEAKVMCFYRRRDLPNPLIQLADKHQSTQNRNIYEDNARNRKLTMESIHSLTVPL
ncbi:Metastasis-associated protein MTA1 [Operophtera brumata]|uniref:Metastasis-associated protein MTA1 n=1 Tax=Operophtera brumata TaxID=104452 RepID=A0A0L7LME8_OPEBR|nr:Metastasis-associated protein MTA1 [Operophtera brumata]